MSCSKLKVSTATSKYSDGIAFIFKFSRGANLSLVAVDIKNGIPKLRFAPAQNVPALTEEDVAVIVQLCLDGKRPEFFYEGFHPQHPFHNSGRFFKGYRPRYLRGTSVGETLAEADWAMKCLHVGVRSDKEKKRFYSWNETSNLTGLRTREDFDENRTLGPSIIMKCDSVDVSEETEELCFIGQPKMRIEIFNSDYSKYITKIFNSVAYHDEPLFLKVQEIVKLVLAVEWLHKKLSKIGMSFSHVWAREHLNKPKQQTNELVEVVVPCEEAKCLLNKMVTTEEYQDNQLAIIGDTRVKILNKKVSQCGFQVEAEAITQNTACTQVRAVAQIRGTFNDYDFLYEGLDPNQLTGIDFNTREPLIPNVKSWNELRRETVPCPCTALYSPADGRIGPPVTGGVTTQSFSTNHVINTACVKSEIVVPAGEQVRLKYADTPKPSVSYAPSTDVGVNTAQSEKRHGLRSVAGHCNYRDRSSYSVYSEKGELLAEMKRPDTRVCGTKTFPISRSTEQKPNIFIESCQDTSAANHSSPSNTSIRARQVSTTADDSSHGSPSNTSIRARQVSTTADDSSHGSPSNTSIRARQVSTTADDSSHGSPSNTSIRARQVSTTADDSSHTPTSIHSSVSEPTQMASHLKPLFPLEILPSGSYLVSRGSPDSDDSGYADSQY